MPGMGSSYLRCCCCCCPAGLQNYAQYGLIIAVLVLVLLLLCPAGIQIYAQFGLIVVVLLIIAVLQCSLSSSAAAHQRSQNSHFVAAAAVSVRCGCLAARPGSPTLSSSSVLQLWQSHTCPSSAACQASQFVVGAAAAAGVSCHSARHYQSLLVPAHCRQQNIAVTAAAAIAANRTAWPPSPRSPTGTVIAAPKTVLNSTNVGLTAHYNL